MKMKQKMVITIKQEDIKQRNIYAYALHTNGLFRPKVVKSKKTYNRQRFKKEGKDYDSLPSFFRTHNHQDILYMVKEH